MKPTEAIDALYPAVVKVIAIAGALSAWDKETVPLDEEMLSGLGLCLQEVGEELKEIMEALEELDLRGVA